MFNLFVKWTFVESILEKLNFSGTEFIKVYVPPALDSKHKPGCKTAGGFNWYYADDPTQPDKSKIIPNNTNLIKEVS